MNAAESLLQRTQLATRPRSISSRIVDCAPFLSEFLGSLLLAVVWNCTFVTSDVTFRCVILGMSLLVATCAFAPISGAHFNPAVSFAVALAGSADWSITILYMVMQLFGSCAGIGISLLMFGKAPQDELGLHHSGFNDGAVFSVEFVYTGLLCLTYLNTVISRTVNPVTHGNQFFAVAMGFAMVAAVATAGGISGAVFNPALAVAVMLEQHPSNIWLFLEYIVAHGWGAGFAAVAFRILRPAEHEKYEKWLQFMETERFAGFSAAQIFSEAIGSWIFVFTASVSMLYGSGCLFRAWTIGSTIIALHYSVADISGGYFNPVVTLSVLMSWRKHCSILQGLVYIVTQCLSGCVASFLAFSINSSAARARAKEELTIGAVRVAAVETFFMVVVCLAVLATSTSKGINTQLHQNYYHGIAYGFAYIGGGAATLKVTGGALLPSTAIIVGSAVQHVQGLGGHAARVLTSEIASAILAAIIFRLTHFNEYEDSADDDMEASVGEHSRLTAHEATKSTWTSMFYLGARTLNKQPTTL